LIFKRILSLVAAIAALAAAAAVCVVALAFALYAFVRDWIGPAGGAAVVAGVAALLAVGVALFLTRKAKPKPVKGDEQNLSGKLVELARERPLVAAGAIAAAVAVIVRNPRVLSAVVTAAMAGRAARKR
jgi:hypothetical protein